MPTKEERISKEKEAKKQARNRKYKTLIKNQFKKIEVYLKEKKTDEKELKNLVSEAQKVLDKAKNKKVIHKNKSARKKRQLYKKLSALGGGKEVNQAEKNIS
jgi:small subunit ribosomal protein S20